jgi:hypothetical protein
MDVQSVSTDVDDALADALLDTILTRLDPTDDHSGALWLTTREVGPDDSIPHDDTDTPRVDRPCLALDMSFDGSPETSHGPDVALARIVRDFFDQHDQPYYIHLSAPTAHDPEGRVVVVFNTHDPTPAWSDGQTVADLDPYTTAWVAPAGQDHTVYRVRAADDDGSVFVIPCRVRTTDVPLQETMRQLPLERYSALEPVVAEGRTMTWSQLVEKYGDCYVVA